MNHRQRNVIRKNKQEYHESKVSPITCTVLHHGYYFHDYYVHRLVMHTTHIRNLFAEWKIDRTSMQRWVSLEIMRCIYLLILIGVRDIYTALAPFPFNQILL